MWPRGFRLLGIVVASVFLGYLIGSNGAGVLTLSSPSASSPFLISDLTIQPEVARPSEIVTITVSVANTADTGGIYSLVLKINGLREAEKQATVDAGSTHDVSFTVAREEPGRYTVFINGVSCSFTVVAPEATH